MADDTLHLPERPSTWSDAFAALPLEAAPSAAWPRLQTTLDSSLATNRRHAPSRWLAAAALAALALLPWAWFAYAPQRHGEDAMQQPAPESRHIATLPIGPDADPRPAAVRVAEEPAADTRSNASPRTESPRDSIARDAHRTVRAAQRHRDAKARALANAASTRADAPDAPGVADTDAGVASSTQTLQALYAESARLEALLQLTRDESVASAASAVLTDEADARVQLIDAALSQGTLTPARRTELWEQRVAALRDLAGVASTTRWLAAHGEQLEDAIVRVD